MMQGLHLRRQQCGAGELPDTGWSRGGVVHLVDK